VTSTLDTERASPQSPHAGDNNSGVAGVGPTVGPITPPGIRCIRSVRGLRSALQMLRFPVDLPLRFDFRVRWVRWRSRRPQGSSACHRRVRDFVVS